MLSSAHPRLLTSVSHVVVPRLVRLLLAAAASPALISAAETKPAASASAPALPATVGFNQHIRPILSNMCFHCHGPDDKTRDGDLRLDTRDGALENKAIVPGNPDASEVMLRIQSHDRSEMMPPPKAKKPALSADQVALVRKWIEQGAKYEEHWAFLPLRKEGPPSVQPQGSAWPKNEIDRFILARLEREGIQPSPEADRATLIRRVTLDLTGLLPTPEESRKFSEDADPQAYEKLVQRLLDSPHYGERWGRHWLDQARYADSHGYTIDGERGMWPYRDWVIKALNEDMPFNQFTLEQLAGDLLPKPTKNQVIATGFHRNTLINEEGGTDPEQFRVEAVMDRVNTTGAVWLGLTVGCAQCHTHKFDPITHQDYYQMYAFFNQGTDVNNKGATMEVTRGEVFGKAVKLEKAPVLASATPAADKGANSKPAVASAGSKPSTAANAGQSAEDKALHAALAALKWEPAQYVEYDTATNAGFKLLPDNSLLADGGGSFNDSYRILAKGPLPQVGAVRLRVLPHESLPRGGPGFAGNGNFVLTDFEITKEGQEVPVVRAVADHEQPGYGAAAAIDNSDRTGWAINVGKGADPGVKMNAPHEVMFILEKPVTLGGEGLEFRLHHDLNEKYLIGRLALDFIAAVPDAARKPAPAPVLAGVSSNAAAAPAVAPKGKKAKPGATADVAETMVMKDLDKARPTFLFHRGDFLRPDEKLGPLQPGVIAAIQAAMPAGTKHQFKNRLDLAKWLVEPANPLTSRVTVNRAWMHYFGRGIVETEEDFGSQGSAPVHPELLDWLAAEFMKRGWSMKALHRLIVTSATYRQSSHARLDLAEKDPRNLLLARQERVRVEAEIIRDAGLCASGLLNPEIGGPSVRPPQPEGVYSFTQNKKSWTTATGPDRYRRGMYTLFYRSAPHPLFTTFDAPDFQLSCTRRSRSNTPLQALTIANDEAFVEMARAMAVRVAKVIPGRDHPGQSDGRIMAACHIAYGRQATGQEYRLLKVLYRSLLQDFLADRAAAQALWGNAPLPPDTHVEQAAALAGTMRAILNTDAFVTRE